MYKSLASYLEENLYRETEQYGKIARTAAIFLAVENRDKVTVDIFLDDFPNRSHFYKHMRTIPGQIFPKDAFLQHLINVSPVALALRQKDVGMLQLLHKSIWGKELMFTKKVMQLNVNLCLELLREDEAFFENPDLSILRII